MDRINDIIIAGVGGQGVILAGTILTRAFLTAGFDVKQAEIHGMAQRGGSVESFVRRGEKVHSPLVRRGGVDAILALETSESLRWLDYLRPGGLVVASRETIVPVTVTQGISRYPQAIAEEIGRRTDRLLFADTLSLARQAGNAKAANVVLLGLFARNLELERSLWEETIARCVPERAREVNQRAFALGWEHFD